jgi:hypothetical protein
MSLQFSPFASETLLLQGAHLSQNLWPSLFILFFASKKYFFLAKKRRKETIKPEYYKTASGKLRLL